MNQYIRWFTEIRLSDVPLVGGKNASLGEMFRELTADGINVPAGFAITAHAYHAFLWAAGLDQKLPGMLAGIDSGNIEELRRRATSSRHPRGGIARRSHGPENHDRHPEKGKGPRRERRTS